MEDCDFIDKELGSVLKLAEQIEELTRKDKSK